MQSPNIIAREMGISFILSVQLITKAGTVRTKIEALNRCARMVLLIAKIEQQQTFS